MYLRTALALLMTAGAAVSAQTRAANPDFSGTWTMDAARSESAHQAVALGSMTLVITQSPSDVVIETVRRDGETSSASNERLTYRLDGSEMSIPGKSEVPIKTRARWEGSKLITETARSINGAAVTMTHVLSLDSGRKVLTIDKTLTVQHGYQNTSGKNSGTGRDVFVRAKAAENK